MAGKKKVKLETVSTNAVSAEKFDIYTKELETIKLVCVDCKEEFPLHPAEQKFFVSKELDFPKRCRGCREKRKQKSVHTCKDCNKQFEVSYTDAMYYEHAGMEQPKRCAGCRRSRKEFKDGK